MSAGLIMLICFVVTMALLAPLVALIVNFVAFENGHYDHARAEPRKAPYHPEYHTQLHGREHN